MSSIGGTLLIFIGILVLVANGQDDDLSKVENHVENEASVEESTTDNCRQRCGRLYLPLCASFNGKLKTSANICEYENNIRCAIEEFDQENGDLDIHYLYNGTCLEKDIATQIPRPTTKLSNSKSVEKYLNLREENGLVTRAWSEEVSESQERRMRNGYRRVKKRRRGMRRRNSKRRMQRRRRQKRRRPSRRRLKRRRQKRRRSTRSRRSRRRRN